MQIKPIQIRINEDNPFAEDKLKREENAEILTQLIATIKEPFVLAIDSPWGTGKTTFLTMWLQSLRKKGYPCLYFNAWENDFSDDPLVSLIGEIETGLDSIITDTKRKGEIKKYFLKTKKIGSLLLKKSLPVAIKIVTAGAIDTDKIYEEALADLAEKVAKDKIDKYEADKLTIRKFKEQLSDFVTELAKTNKDDNAKPLIFFIDELDRCRPDFAIELLEKAKHFFNIDGIIFILAIDKQQIGHSIRSIYGTGMDVDGYLRRFIDIDYRLPDPGIQNFCYALFDKFGFDEYFEKRTTHDARYEKKQFIEVFSRLFALFGFSLRVQEQCFSQLSLALRTTPLNFKLHPLFLGALITLKTANPKLYNDLVRGKVEAEEILKYIREAPGGNAFLEENYGMALEAYFASGRYNNWRDVQNIADRYKKIAEDDKIPAPQRERANTIAQLMNSFLIEDSYGVLEYLAKKIEITERFTSS